METQPTNNREEVVIEKQPNTTLKVIVLVILIALLITGILLPIKLVPNAVTSIKNGFSSLFGGGETATLTTDKSEINSGEAFTLSWDGKHKDNGSYVLTYACKDGVHMQTSIYQPNQEVPCDSQYYFSPNDNRIDLSIFSENNRFIDVPVSLSFLANDSTEVKTLASTTLTITNVNVADSRQNITGTSTTPTPVTVATSTTPVEPTTPAPVATTPAPKPTITRTHRVSNPNGTADLSVQITDIGYLDPVTAQFVSSPTIYGNARAAAKFVVTNNGDKNTGAWNFTATLPTVDHPTYTAYNQPNLGPGDGIVYTLGFDKINQTLDNVISIAVDSNNQVVETSETNNTSSVHIANLSGTNNGTPTNVGGADLTVKITSIPSYTYANSRVNVQFEVQNIGDQTVNSWRFTANLPTGDSNSFYTSEYQAPLAPGAKIIFNLGFDRTQYQGNNNVSITVDPYNNVSEVNENNNSTSATIYRY